jgi:hypothetical protein
MCEFVRENEHCSEAQALMVIKELSFELDADHTIYYSGGGTAAIIDKDDTEWYRKDLPGCSVYDGPDLVWS